MNGEIEEIDSLTRELSAKLELMAESGVQEYLVRKRGIKEIGADIKSCTRCGLSALRSSVTEGIGTGKSGLFIVVEKPFENSSAENRYGGEDGKFLIEIISKGLKVDPGQVYTSFLIKCSTDKPVGEPKSTEAVCACLPYLLEEIEAMAPKVVLLFGQSVAAPFLNAALGLAPEALKRNRLYDYKKCKVVATYTLKELLEDTEKKGEFWVGAFRQGKIV